MPTFVPTAEPTAQPTAMPEYIQTGPGQAFTGSGNMHTLDVLYSAHTNKQFISLETKSGQTYYLVIDYDKPIDEEADIYETYFLNLVDDRDLLALLSGGREADSNADCRAHADRRRNLCRRMKPNRNRMAQWSPAR